MVDLNTINPAHLWYIIGLITSDSNLSKDRRHINITSKDESILLSVRSALGLTNKLSIKGRGSDKQKRYYFLQFGDVNFYRFLLSIGLMPNKSLTLGSLNIPALYFPDFLRGIIDGDGCIYSWLHATNNHTQWSLRIAGAAPQFMEWLQIYAQTFFKVQGRMYKHDNRQNYLYNLKFGKLAAKVILQRCYYENCLCLDRKLSTVKQLLATPNGLSKYANVIDT